MKNKNLIIAVVLSLLLLMINREFILPLFTTDTGHFFLLAAAVLEVNRDFFSQRLAPMIRELTQRLASGAK